MPLSVLRPPSLIGREAEWARLEDAWDAGRFLILAGEGGVGKSRLARDFAASKGEVLLLEGRPGDALVPYATTTRNLRRIFARTPDLPLEPWMRASLSRLLPELQVGPPAPVEPDARLHEAIHHVFRTGLEGVSAIVYDDLHLADPASIEAGFVLISSSFPLGQPGGVPRLICTVRPFELQPATAEVFAQLRTAGQGVRIDLEPLGAAAVGALLRDLDVPEVQHLGPQLARFTGGNPLFVLETVKHLLEAPAQDGALPVAARVTQLIEGRLARLSAAALAAARGAAVLQSDVRIELVADVLGTPLLDTAAAWEELEAAQVMTGERFSHDLVQEAVLGGIPTAVRRLLNRSAARVLERDGASAARVARHWLEGGDEARATPWLLRAADAARRQGRLHEAIRFCEQAADLFEARGAQDDAFEALHRAVQLMADAPNLTRLPHLGARLTALARSPQQHARAREARMHQLYEHGDWPQLRALAHETLAQAVEAHDRRFEAVCHEALATVALLEGQLGDAHRHLEQLGDIAVELNDAPLRAKTLLGLGRIDGHTDRRAAVEHYAQARALYADVIHEHTGQVAALTKMAVLQQELGDAKRALDTALRAQEVLEQLEARGPFHLAVAHSVFVARHALHELTDAMQTVLAALERVEPDQLLGRAVLRMDLAQLYLTLGAPDAARAEVQAMASQADLTAVDQSRFLLLSAQVQPPGTATEAFEAALAHPATRANAYRHAVLLVAWGAALDASAALRAAESALDLARRSALLGVEVAALTRRGQAHLALGQVRAAVEDSAEAVRLAPSCAPELPVGEVLGTHAAALEAAGDPRAAQVRDAARAWLEEAVRRVPEAFRASYLARHTSLQGSVEVEPGPDGGLRGLDDAQPGTYK